VIPSSVDAWTRELWLLSGVSGIAAAADLAGRAHRRQPASAEASAEAAALQRAFIGCSQDHARWCDEHPQSSDLAPPDAGDLLDVAWQISLDAVALILIAGPLLADPRAAEQARRTVADAESLLALAAQAGVFALRCSPDDARVAAEWLATLRLIPASPRSRQRKPDS
jgi:hypothetical protein